MSYVAAKATVDLITGKYDVIGDIHGHAAELRRLLLEMEYSEDDGAFSPSGSSRDFVGDFIDRGPEQREVLRIARSMCDAGTALAVMGNHEFNAPCWAEPDGNGGFLRPSQRFTKAGLHDASHRGSKAYNAAEVLLRGPEHLLPVGCSFEDQQGDRS